MPKYDVDVVLLGQDGNAFAIISKVRKALRDADVPSEEIDLYVKEGYGRRL